MLIKVFFNLGYSFGINLKQFQFSQAGRNVCKFSDQPIKCVICWNSSLFLFQMYYFESTIVLEHVWIKTKHLSHTSAERKVFCLFTEKVWKIDEINTNIMLSCSFAIIEHKIYYIPLKVAFHWYQIYWHSSKFDYSLGTNVTYGRFSRA